MIKIKAKPFDKTIIQIYEPTTTQSDVKTEAYYEAITMMFKEVKSTDILLTIGDFNAKLEKGTYQNLVGHFGLGERSTRRDRLEQFCVEHDLVITNTYFQNPKDSFLHGRAKEMCPGNK